jgi:hypothetical protein
LKSLQGAILGRGSRLVDRDEPFVAGSDRVVVDPFTRFEVIEHGFERRLEIALPGEIRPD